MLFGGKRLTQGQFFLPVLHTTEAFLHRLCLGNITHLDHLWVAFQKLKQTDHSRPTSTLWVEPRKLIQTDHHFLSPLLLTAFADRS